MDRPSEGETLDGLGDAVLLVRFPRDPPGEGLEFRHAVPHRDAVAGVGNHSRVVHRVADDEDVLPRDPELFREDLEAGALVGGGGEDLEEVGLRDEDIDLLAEAGPDDRQGGLEPGRVSRNDELGHRIGEEGLEVLLDDEGEGGKPGVGMGVGVVEGRVDGTVAVELGGQAEFADDGEGLPCVAFREDVADEDLVGVGRRDEGAVVADDVAGMEVHPELGDVAVEGPAVPSRGDDDGDSLLLGSANGEPVRLGNGEVGFQEGIVQVEGDQAYWHGVDSVVVMMGPS